MDPIRAERLNRATGTTGRHPQTGESHLCQAIPQALPVYQAACTIEDPPPPWGLVSVVSVHDVVFDVFRSAVVQRPVVRETLHNLHSDHGRGRDFDAVLAVGTEGGGRVKQTWMKKKWQRTSGTNKAETK